MRSEVQRLPELFLERLRKIIPSQKWDAVANTFADARPTTFRVNTLKVGAGPRLPAGQAGARPVPNSGAHGGAPLQESLEHLGFRLEKVGGFPDTFVLRDGRLRDLQETDAYKKGEIYVQSLSSMIPPLVLDPKPGEKILDLTAAPGSKTTQMACLMKGEGTILANDNNRVRFFKLKANVELQDATNVELSCRPGELFGRDFPGTFDRVLLDAPCSAEGRFQVKEPGSYKYWKPAKVKEMARKQKNLILSAFRALKPGGVLVYSTCTFAPEENEAVLDWLLHKVGAPLQIESIRLPFPNQTSGLLQWEGKAFNPSVRNTVRILPTPLMEGFFVARLHKISERDLSLKEEFTSEEWDKLEKLAKGPGKVYRTGAEFLKSLGKR